MNRLKYGINKVPGSGTIEIRPNMPIRIRLPERPPISETLKTPEQQAEDQYSSDARKDVLRSFMANSKSIDPESVVKGSEFLLPDKEKQFKRLDDVRNQIMEKQKILDDMADYAARHHPGILEDMKNRTTNYIQDYLQMFPEHEKVEQELIDLQDQYQDDPLHDEHFEGVLNKLRGNK